MCKRRSKKGACKVQGTRSAKVRNKGKIQGKARWQAQWYKARRCYIHTGNKGWGMPNGRVSQ